MLSNQARLAHGPGQLYRMDPIADGNPIGWSIRTMERTLPKMLVKAGYPDIAGALDPGALVRTLPEVEACARELYAAKRNTVKHNRGTHVYDLGAIKIGLEMRRLPVGDGGLAIHVLADLAGSTENTYVEETEILAFDFPRGGFSPPEGRLARGCKPPAFSRFLFQSAVKSAEIF